MKDSTDQALGLLSESISERSIGKCLAALARLAALRMIEPREMPEIMQLARDGKWEDEDSNLQQS